MGTAAVAVAAVLAVEALALPLLSHLWQAPVLPAAASTSETRSASEAGRSLFDVLQTAPVSPRGIPAKGMTQSDAARIASINLFAPVGVRDTDEAAFWLKRALADAVHDKRIGLVLTQLGTAYAAPTNGAPDYATARQIWDLAAALGDPQALCFLARLDGLGLAAPPAAGAEPWKARASEAGCGDARPSPPPPR